MPATAHRTGPSAIRLGSFRIEPELGRVIGPSSSSRLMPGAMDILVYLVERAPRVVSADELLEAFWPGRIVDASTIHRRMSQIRHALNDDPRDPILIATVPKRGYRVIGEVEKSLPADPESNGKADESARDKPEIGSGDGAETGPKSAGISQQVPFIGRETILKALDARLHAAAVGKSGVVLLSGPPGIGKTRCAQELLDHATQRGFEVFSTWCDEHVANVPLWPWTGLVRALTDADHVHSLRPELDHHFAALCELAPELKTRFPDLPELRGLEASAHNVRLQDSVATLIRWLASNRPLVVYIDDLHSADRASLTMLEFVVRSSVHGRILFLCTARNTEVDRRHPLTESVARLARHRGFERISLKGFANSELNQLVACFSREPERFATVIAEKTDGNPLYATLLTRALTTGEDDRLPLDLREVIIGSFAGLSDRCWQVVCVAAVIGHEFSTPLLSAVAAIDEISLEPALLEARRAGVFADEERFSHVLVQEAVFEEIPSAKRRELHGAIATQLAAQPTELLEVAAIMQIARHFALSGQPLAASKWYGRASSKLTGTHDRHAYESALLGLRTLEEHFAIEPTHELARGVVSTTIGALHVAGVAMVPSEDVANLYQRAQQVTRILESREPRLCLLMTVYSDYLWLSDRAEEALQRAEEAYDVGQACGDEGVRLHASITLIGRYTILNRHGDAYNVAIRELHNPPEDLLASFGNGSWPAYPRILAFAALREAAHGCPKEALKRVQQALDLLRKDARQVAPEDVDIQIDQAHYRGTTQTLLECIEAAATCYSYLGDAERLEKCANHYQEWVRNHQPQFRPNGHRLLAQYFWLTKGWQELADMDNQAPNDFARHTADPHVIALRALALAHLGDRAAAETMIETLLDRVENLDPQTLLHCAQVLVRSGSKRDLSRAIKLADDIGKLLDRTATEGDRPYLIELCAQIALVTGDELDCQRQQSAARELWLNVGAPAQIARMVDELRTLSREAEVESISRTSE